jgi:hypothetical protein
MADRALEIVSIKDPADFGLAGILAVGDRVLEWQARPRRTNSTSIHASRGKTVAIRWPALTDASGIVLPTAAVAGLESGSRR